MYSEIGSSLAARDQVLVKEKGENKKVIVKEHQVHAHKSINQVVTHICNPAWSTTSLNSTAGPLLFYLEANSMNFVRDLCFRFKVSENNTAAFTPMPTPLWFERIEIINRANGTEICRIYGDTLWWVINTMDYKYRESWAEVVGYNPKDIGWLTPYVHKQAQEKVYYMPIPSSFFEDAHISMHEVMSGGDIEFRFFPRGSIVGSGTGVPVLNEMALLTGEESLLPKDLQEYKLQMKAHDCLHYFYDVQQYLDSSRAMVASTEYTFNLDSFNHKSMALLFCIRESLDNKDGGSLKYIDLGPSATVDVKGVSGKSLYGHGRPVYAEYLREILGPRFFGNAWNKYNAVYLIDFTDDLSQAIAGGVQNGFHQFRGERETLSITTMAAPVNGNCTFTPNANATGGTYRIGFRGQWTNAIAYGAAIADIKAAVEALSTVKDIGLQITVAGTIDAGPVVLTYTDRAGSAVSLGGDLFAIDYSKLATTASVAVTSTEASRGFKAGTYTVSIYSLYRRKLILDGPRIKVEKC